jgi:hypothetical protein
MLRFFILKFVAKSSMRENGKQLEAVSDAILIFASTSKIASY